jgi:hypothetical protein
MTTAPARTGRRAAFFSLAVAMTFAMSVGAIGQASATSGVVPGIVTDLTVTAGNGSATLAWTAPTGDVTSYIIQKKEGATVSTVTAGEITAANPAASPQTVTGLTNGTEYQFRIAAVNSHGDGAASAESGTIKPSARVKLGNATSFAVLSDEAVTNTGTSKIRGDVGISPGTAITGFPPGEILGVYGLHSNTAAAIVANAGLIIAYNDAKGRTPSDGTVYTELGGRTLTQGVYNGGALGITGDLTLTGDADSVFIFQSTETLITGSGSKIVLKGITVDGVLSEPVDPCNVFWQVAKSVTLGSNSTMVGTVMSLISITATTGATVEGRLLARKGAVTLDTTTINLQGCEREFAFAVGGTKPVPTTTTPPTGSEDAGSSSNDTPQNVPEDAGSSSNDTPQNVPEARELARTGTDVGFPIIAISTLLVGGVALLTLNGSKSRRRRGGRLSG